MRYLAGSSNINSGLYVATNARGDTAVAWLDPLTGRAKVSDRPAGGAFSDAKLVIGAPDQHLGGVAIDGDGTIYVFLIVDNSNPAYSRPVVATKPVGSGVWASEFLAPASTSDPAQGAITGVVSPSGKVLVTWFQGHTNDASKSKLEYRVKPAGSDTWTPQGDVPGVTWNTFDHHLAMNAAGDAALIYSKPSCGFTTNMLYGATMTSLNVWTAANGITSCYSSDVSVTGSAVAIDGDGNATAAWTHHLDGNDVVQFSTKPLPAGSWPVASLFGTSSHLTSAGIASAPALAIAPDGTTTIAWARDKVVEERTRPAGGKTFAPAKTIANGLSAPQAPVLRAAPDGSVVAAWSSSNTALHSVIGSARRAPGAASFTALPDVPGTGNAMPALGVDDQGNASAAWVHTYDGPQYAVQATGLDVAGPTITDVTFPSTQPVNTMFPYGAKLTDRWSAIPHGTWTFGDGTDGPLSGTRAYTAAGKFAAVLTATDGNGNTTTVSRSIEVTDPSAGGGGAGGTGPAADTTAPVFLSAGISNARFRVDAAGAAEPLAAAAAKRGTTFRYALSEAATVRFAIKRRRPGRRVAGKCVKPKHGNRGKRRCARFVAAGAFTSAGAAGPNAKRFSGKLGTRRLAVGRYRVRLTAVDAAGNRSAARTIAMRVVRW
jgi:hypothetical protein